MTSWNKKAQVRLEIISYGIDVWETTLGSMLLYFNSSKKKREKNEGYNKDVN